MNTPLPDGITVLDPVIRDGAYLAAAVQTTGSFGQRWHVWHATGAYVGFATAADLIPLVIARHRTA